MGKVLIVDDDADLLGVYGEIILDLGHDVVTTDKGTEGVRLAAEEDPDCILLDIQMADMDGLDALSRMTEKDPSIPVVMITGFPSVENAIAALQRGAFDFLPKGSAIQEMTATVERALERRRLIVENRRLLDELQEANAGLERQVDDATAQLREANEFNQNLLEGIDAGLLAANDVGTILFANPSASSTLNMPAGQIEGRNVTEFGFELDQADRLPPRARTPHGGTRRVSKDLDTVGRRIERSQRRAHYKSSEGRDHSFGYSVSEIDHFHGGKHGHIVLFRDVTEMEELKSHMQRLEKLEALNIVIAGVAHEIKNPVAGISGVASVLAETFEDDDPRKEHVRRIVDETKRVTTIVDDFFSFSRPSKPKKVQFDVTDAVDRVVRLLSDECSKRKIKISTSVEPDVPQVRGDVDQIQQIVLNLVMNSMQALDRNGSIGVSVGVRQSRIHSDDRVSIEVRDSGPGFPEEVRNRLFDPFFTTKATGTGLGMHICQTIAMAHGGSVEARNHPEGGALVNLFLPIPADNG